jgi:tRNA(Ile)-lysidine synthase
MRLLRGSGIAGLAAMAAVTERDGLLLARPLLDVPKARLIATLKAAQLDFADDPTNRDPAFTRPRLRTLMPTLAAEGGDARNLARLAARLARANAAIEVLADGAERYLALIGQKSSDAGQHGAMYDARAFARLPDEVRLRLLMRAIDRFGTEGPVELGKAEILLSALDRAANYTLDRAFAGMADGGAVLQGRLKQTMAGALVSVDKGWIRITPAPPRRSRRS